MNASGKKPRLAVLGATRGVSVARFIRGEGRVEIAALCDIDPSRLEHKGRELEADGHAGLRLFGQASDLFDWGEFDAVVVATPDHTHAELAVEAFQRGFHCFVEKPMANRIDSEHELVRAWQASGTIGVVGHEYRYHSLIRAAKERIQKGDIGQPRLAMTVDFCGRMGSYWRLRYDAPSSGKSGCAWFHTARNPPGASAGRAPGFDRSTTGPESGSGAP